MAAVVALNVLLSSAHAYVMDSRRWESGAITMHLRLDTAPLPRPLADGSTSWGQVAQQALSEWNAVISKSQFVAVQNSSVPVGRQNGVNNVFFSPTVYGEAWGNGVVGLTITVMQGSGNMRRAESDVLFNSMAPMDSYRGPLGSAGPWYDFKRLALHEFGHVLGLGHPDDSGQNKVSVMNSAISDTDRLTADDIEGAQSGYGVPAGNSAGLAPSIVSVNGDQAAVAGSSTTFSVVAKGTGPFTYQWKKDGLILAGEVGPSLVLEPVNSGDAGTYTVMISNALGSVSTLVGQLSVVTPPPARLVNLSVRTMQSANQTLVVGLTAAGKPLPVLLRAVGPTLTKFGVAEAMPDPSLSVFKSATPIDSNDNWGGSAALSQVFLSAGAFALPVESLDAALVRSIEGGNTVQVRAATG
ncbi:MAG: matrixin family metalloprotease, partial [Opitutaceae bacterium]|nr:matrixin family metalloprotease [Opitutaceae bacterium]